MFASTVQTLITAAMLLSCKAVEINLLDDFEINEGMENIQETTGLQYEGRAFEFGDVKQDLMKKGKLPSEIGKQAKIYAGFTVTANVKIQNNQECALLWIETIYTQPLLGIWIMCNDDSCRLTMLYMIHRRSYEVQFDNIGPLYDEDWHKLVVHVQGVKKSQSPVASVYVDCAKQDEKALKSNYNILIPFVNKKPTSSNIWLAQRSRGRRGGFERPWKGSLQNLKFVFNRDIEKLTDQTVCSNLKGTRRKQYSPPVTENVSIATDPQEVDINSINGPLRGMASHVSQLEIILSNQVEETKYLRRMIENFHYADRRVTSCNLRPCYPGVLCIDTPDHTPGYRCGNCPMGLEGDGVNCTELDECKHNPCFNGVKCTNFPEGYKCGPCPVGYRGGAVMGNGKEHAMKKQVCVDIDECSIPNTCARFSDCMNTLGSYKCGECEEGYYGNPYVNCERKIYCSGAAETNPCDKNALCISKHHGRSFECSCKVGYTGDGLYCGRDSDLDGVPDYALACTGPQCTKDNCKDFPNPDQSDLDKDGAGDACDNDMDGDGVPNERDNCPKVVNADQRASDSDSHGDACDNCPTVVNEDQLDHDGVGQGDACDTDMDNDGVINRRDNCPVTRNSDQRDEDGDGIGDVCDNCPEVYNPRQEDTDHDFVGDDCDNDRDRDRDGVQDSLDNCPYNANAAQLDNDKDREGNTCDNNDDNDYLIDIHDNCPLISNSYQKLSAAHGRGEECKHDYDGDRVKDKNDACPHDATMTALDFTDHIVFRPGGESTINTAAWKVDNDGRQVTKGVDNGDSIFIGNRAFESAEFNGTIYVNSDGDGTVGIIFGFQSAKIFYIVMWQKSLPGAGFVIKEVKSSTGPSRDLFDALKNSQSVSRQTKILWEDPKKQVWEHRTAYKFIVRLNSRKKARVDVYKGSDKIISSPELYADLYRGGRLGMFSFNQHHVIWTALDLKCLD
ncbi:cartilage oligomeric matrix protein-like [Dendronephthya gigantea]|uniref:cartilage oligomeric matrix protein-like n=1 Tax=Dendronephthya gigantea TaxID=151771 RepID=UPI00106B9B07|nr:cartilage oligomeric matrix protein-like [Dendronephthya gigantea]